MNQFPPNIQFKYPWRKYQERVLEQLQNYTTDNHLHIIAPPGSGKTVLGLEVALRLNKPTLIFAPTIAIKNQWIQRFCELFLRQDEKPEWISDNIKQPKFLTISTYQALYAACTNSDIEEETNESEEESDKAENGKSSKQIDVILILKLLRAQNIGTIVMDEAHHLKNEWWKPLSSIVRHLNPSVVGLTATPPYDVSFVEWRRYLDLNGAIDTEISVPELVIENDLCPHQDYVYLSEPTETEKKIIKSQKDKVYALFKELKTDVLLTEAIENHPIYLSPTENLEWIYTNLEYYSAFLIYLNSCGIEISEKHLEVIGDKKLKIPSLDYTWMERLLTFYLFIDDKNFLSYESHKELITGKLSRIGVLERKSICFSENRRINKYLETSLNKLNSIEKIVEIERCNLKNDLRMVILTDFIRKEFLVTDTCNNLEINKIGVFPIFEMLRRKNIPNLKLGILSGSLIIIPSDALTSLLNACKPHFSAESITFSALSYDTNYIIINTSEQIKRSIVSLVTQIFEQGEINILVGTKSLLGEGWDAPAINWLILASFVGSFVLSNQMRGRAIRVDRRNPHKTGNIWHLVCIDKTDSGGGSDLELLRKRFKGFVGLSFEDETSIENGTSRMKIPHTFVDNEIETYNAFMSESASHRHTLKLKWTEALKEVVSLTEEIKVPFQPKEKKDYQGAKSMYFNKTIGFSVAALTSGITSFSLDMGNSFLRSLRNFDSISDFWYWLFFMGIIGFLSFGGLAYKTLRMYIKHRDIGKDFYQISDVVLDSLVKIGVIHTQLSELQNDVSIDKYGTLYCHLQGGTSFEKSVFIKSLQEVVAPINNPKYIIVRKSMFLRLINQIDYYSVPELIGQNKKQAEYFAKQ